MARNTETATARIFMDGEQAGVELKKLEDQTSELKKEIVALNKEGKSKEAEARKKDLKFLQKETRKLKEETFDTAKVLKNLNGASLDQLKKSHSKLTKEVSRLNQGTDEYVKKSDDLKRVSAQMKKVRSEMYATNKTSGGLLQSVKGLLPAFGFAAIIGGAVALGKKVFNLAQQTMKYRKQVQQLTGETGQSLADLTAGIEASANTFDKEVEELAVANNTLAKSFNISQQAANELIDKGFLAGADASGEFIDMLKEYPVQFKAAGLSAEQSIALMTQSVKEGIYSDKGPDVIKEGTIRLREMTKATREALEGIGISSVQLEEDLKKGTISYFDAIQMVSNKLGELPSQSTEVGTALADIFGGPGEDAGLEYVKMLGNVETNMDKVIAKTGDSSTAQGKLLEANKKLGKAWSDLLGTGTGTFTSLTAGAKSLLADGLVGIMDGMAGVRDWFIEIYNESLPIRAYINYMLAVWNTGIELVKANLKALWTNLKTGGKLIKAVLTFNLSEVKQAIADWKDEMAETVTDGAKSIAEGWTDAYNETIKGRIEPVKQVVETVNRDVNESSSTHEVATSYVENDEDKQRAEEEDWINRMEQFQSEANKETEILQHKYSDQRKASQKHALDIDKIEAKSLKSKGKRVKAEGKLDKARGKLTGEIADSVIAVAGKETAAGKAALIAKQGIALRESAISLGVGSANTAKVGFPQNIPLLIAFAAQAVSITKSIVGAIKGFFFGGDTGRAGRNDVAGVVHGQEYVIPAELYKDDPLVSALVAGIIEPKRAGIRGINYSLANENIDTVRGYRSGGEVDEEPAWESGLPLIPTELLNAINEFNRQISNGIQAHMSYSGPKGFKKTTEKYQKREESMKVRVGDN